jgi:glutathione S-transferase
MLRLYTTPLSANGRKVLAVSHELALSPDIHEVNVYRGEGQAPAYLAIHPQGKIPALVDGDFTLTESNAICVYLAEAHGDCRLWAREPRRRAALSRWLYWEASEWQPALVPVLAPLVASLVVPHLAGAAPVEVDWSDARFQRQARFLDAELATRAYVGGDQLTLADFVVAGVCTYFRAARFPFEVFPHIGNWYERMEERPAWRDTAAGPWR